jgi:hypothetical protein
MPNNERYLIDSDVLITSKNLYYRPDYCEAFWTWIVSGHAAGRLFSIDKVKQELLNGNKEDPLHQWAQNDALENFFLGSATSTPKWKDLASWAVKGNYLQAAKDKFLNASSADAWLIAVAAAEGDCVIVTNETSAPQSQKNIKLPDAAAALNVKTISLFELLQGKAHKTFEYK